MVAGRFRLFALGMAMLGLSSGICQPIVGQDLLSALSSSGNSGIPNDWYFGNGEGIDELRALEGKEAPAFTAAEWRGDQTSLEQLRGKVVVLDFWATWCGPCMAAIPKNVALMEKYKDKGVALIGIHDSNSGWDTVDQVIAEKGIDYPVALDAKGVDQGESTKAYALKFWPTYVVIDAKGIVRAAGLKPDKIEDAVKLLLDEALSDPSSAVGSKIAGFPDHWYLGGEARSTSAKEMEGKPAPDIAVAGWIGEPVDSESWKQRVRVLQFVRPEIKPSVAQLALIQPIADRFATQGVSFVALCDARSSPDRMKTVAQEKGISLPVAIDKPIENGANGVGSTGELLGIKFAPATIVVDRAGIVRAVGLKPQYLEKVLNRLLAESVTVTDTEPMANTTPAPATTTEPDSSQPIPAAEVPGKLPVVEEAPKLDDATAPG